MEGGLSKMWPSVKLSASSPNLLNVHPKFLARLLKNKINIFNSSLFMNTNV